MVTHGARERKLKKAQRTDLGYRPSFPTLHDLIKFTGGMGRNSSKYIFDLLNLFFYQFYYL